jgi:fermentation-respiration switch protein FrsA (DUF1100 family)
VAFDYSGYGHSTGSPGEGSLKQGWGGYYSCTFVFSDMEAVYDYLLLHYSPSLVVLYGHSVGSVPVVHLASVVHGLGGVVLQSPLRSGVSLLTGTAQPPPWYDVLNNLDRIGLVTCPVFIIHGTADVEVPLEHGVSLYEACKVPYTPWWVPGGGHNDIDVLWSAAYFARLQAFLRDIRPRTRARGYVSGLSESALGE